MAYKLEDTNIQKCLYDENVGSCVLDVALENLTLTEPKLGYILEDVTVIDRIILTYGFIDTISGFYGFIDDETGEEYYYAFI